MTFAKICGCAVLVMLGSAPAVAQTPRPSRPNPPTAPVVDLPTVRMALVGRDVDAAIHAATLLGGLTDPAAHEVLLDALATGLHPKVAAEALVRVAARPAPADAAVIRSYATHRNIEARAAALRSLGAYGDAASQKAIVVALGDEERVVRAAAAEAAARGHVRDAGDRLLALLAKGDLAAAAALAEIADVDLARRIADLLGTAPDAPLARCLGLMLRRADFGPDPVRVQVVGVLAKMTAPEARTALEEYVEATPAKPPRPSRREAENALTGRTRGS